MTVTIDKTEEIHWGAFFAALILAPIAVAVFGIWMYGIPLFALIFGSPTYLIFGAPLFAIWISKRHAGHWGLAFAGFLANLLSTPAVYGYGVLNGSDGMEYVHFIIGFGCVFAPLWGFAFGLFYRGLINE